MKYIIKKKSDLVSWNILESEFNINLEYDTVNYIGNLCTPKTRFKGASINHVDTKGGRRGQPNVYVCLRGGEGGQSTVYVDNIIPF